MPLGDPETKKSKVELPGTAMRLYSGGLYTKLDAYLYSFDARRLSARASTMIDFYEYQRHEIAANRITLEDAWENRSPHILRWNHDLKSRLSRNILAEHNSTSACCSLSTLCEAVALL